MRQLLAKGNSVIGTAREPAKADKLQKLATDRLNIHYVDTSDSSSIKARSCSSFQSRPCLASACAPATSPCT